MSLYIILIIQGSFSRCSLLTNGIRAHGGVGQMWQDYQSSFRSWSRNGMCVCKAISQVEQGLYIALSKLIKITQTILEKRPNKGVLLLMVLKNGEVQGTHKG